MMIQQFGSVETPAEFSSPAIFLSLWLRVDQVTWNVPAGGLNVDAACPIIFVRSFDIFALIKYADITLKRPL